MRLMKLELKRVLKTRLTLILLTFSLVLSLVMEAGQALPWR